MITNHQNLPEVDDDNFSSHLEPFMIGKQEVRKEPCDARATLPHGPAPLRTTLRLK
jgi:hypothetical protein